MMKRGGGEVKGVEAERGGIKKEGECGIVKTKKSAIVIWYVVIKAC